MAIYPKAVVRLLPESGSQPRITPTQVIAHTAVDGANTRSLFDWFDKPSNLESHFYVAANGTVEQYMDTGVRADANNKANRRPDGTGAISIETHDGWVSTGRAGAVTTPWTDAQVAALVELIGWICATHSIPPVICPAWDGPGIGWHNLYPQWSPGATGCPGPTRAGQLRDEIIPAVASGNTPATPSEEDDMRSLLVLDPDAPDGKVWEVFGLQRRHVANEAERDGLMFTGGIYLGPEVDPAIRRFWMHARTPVVTGSDPAAIADAVIASLGGDLAGKVVDELARRLA